MITSADFTGIYVVGKNLLTTAELDDFIELNEEKYCSQIFGAELWKLIKLAIADNIEDYPSYKKVIEPFNEDVCGRMLSSTGLADVLKGLIYFDFIAHSSTRPNFAGGLSAKKVENSTSSAFPEVQAYDKWNRAVSISRNIQDYIMLNRNDYPEFNGVRLTYNTGF
jgi:hypothetical protein